MSVYKLIYFPARGRAEPIRYMLAFSGASFEDIRIPYDQWANEKRSLFAIIQRFCSVAYLHILLMF